MNASFGIFDQQTLFTAHHKLVYRRTDGDVYGYAGASQAGLSDAFDDSAVARMTKESGCNLWLAHLDKYQRAPNARTMI